MLTKRDIPQRLEYQFDKTKYQIVNVFKIIWLKIQQNGGAQQQLLDQVQLNKIVFKSITKHKDRSGQY